MNDIMRALAGGLDPEVAVNREVLRAAVMRRITCPNTGNVLDVRTAVYFAVTDTTNGRHGCEVVDGAAWDAGMGEAIREQVAQTGGRVELEVIDGRRINGRGSA